MTLDDILAVYRGSSAEATRALYRRLEALAPRGPIAVKLLQACKASERAKTYSRRFAAQAYDKKDWAIGELCRALIAEPDVVTSWGWGRDPKAVGFENVIYVDVPGSGQISFHTEHRRDGPDYRAAWDGAVGNGPTRICLWAAMVIAGVQAEPTRAPSASASSFPAVPRDRHLLRSRRCRHSESPSVAGGRRAWVRRHLLCGPLEGLRRKEAAGAAQATGSAIRLLCRRAAPGPRPAARRAQAARHWQADQIHAAGEQPDPLVLPAARARARRQPPHQDEREGRTWSASRPSPD